jgi:1-acyl-sn-glycerol-3-phosphate acyltransferase
VRRGGRGVGGGSSPVISIDLAVNEAGEFELRRQVSPAPDPFGLDLDFRRQTLPLFRFLHQRYWRIEVTGAQNVPTEGPVILVSNHSGALPFDGSMIVTSVELERQRVVRYLYDRFVDAVSPVAAFYRKTGGATATRDNAITLLQAGQALLIFPEGVPGVAKPFSDRYHLQPFQPGFARMAMALDVPIVPVAVVGAEEIYPLMGRAESIGRMLGMPYIPITPFFPVLGMFGTLPLPTKWFIHFGKPLRLPQVDDEARWARAKIEAGRVRRRIQSMVTRLKERRRSVFFG